MKRKTPVAVALCLMMIAIAGGAASSGAAGLSSLPGYEDALAAAKGTMTGIPPSGSLRGLPGYQEALSQWKGMPGATVFPGTIQRVSGAPCYTLTYLDHNQTYTVYLRPHEITWSEGGSPLPTTIPDPVPLDYVGPIDYNHYTLDFRYLGVYYSAPWYTSCQAPIPTITGYYKPIKVYDDTSRFWGWNWYVNAEMSWTVPQEPYPVKASLYVYYTNSYGNQFLAGREISVPGNAFPITPPLIADSSYLSTECDLGSSDIKLCSNPADWSPYTAVGTVWDSYGNAFSVTTTLAPDY